MRSVIQEAASIAQAVELGWIKAGKPKDFSIKIFEEPQKKLFGLITVKKAKIGIFIEDRPQRSGDQRPQQRRHNPHQRRQHGGGQHGQRPMHNRGPQQHQQPQQPNQQPHEEHHDDHNHNGHEGHDHDGGEE